ncbi:cold-shock protein [Streptomyces halobius]|uniref:Cold shock domain-containing protein n=1 Tax=Streptomyces halobius TaxID=2879846 RepID=A0ABY4M532_9ACTN|nr:cold shock domain-containing protein [Streptomyces halobius]UQA92874.1 cold shock domain-containing protein [Streptomyces halobius]
MPEGTVKSYNQDEGHGYIDPGDGSEIFVHYSAIMSSGYRTLNEGQKVTFDVARGPNGVQAMNVRVA